MTGALLTLPLDKMLAKQLSGELAGNGEPGTVSFTKDFSSINDRTLVGEQFCAVPMEDWSINKGRLVHSVCTKTHFFKYCHIILTNYLM